MWLFVVCTPIENEYASLLFSQAFFELFLHIKLHGGKFFVEIPPTFNNFLTFYPYKLKFETLLDTLKI